MVHLQEHGDGMIPVVDMMNHKLAYRPPPETSPKPEGSSQKQVASRAVRLGHDDRSMLPETEVHAEGDVVTVTTAKPVEAGSEVFLTYGPYGGARLLKDHGFCLPQNPYDSLRLRFEDLRDAAVAVRGKARVDPLWKWLVEGPGRSLIQETEQGEAAHEPPKDQEEPEDAVPNGVELRRGAKLAPRLLIIVLKALCAETGPQQGLRENLSKVDRKSEMSTLERRVLQSGILRHLERFEPLSSIAEDEAALEEAGEAARSGDGSSEGEDESGFFAMQAALTLRLSEKRLLADLYGEGPKKAEIEGSCQKRERLVDPEVAEEDKEDAAALAQELEEEDDDIFGVMGSKAKKIKLNTHIKF